MYVILFFHRRLRPYFFYLMAIMNNFLRPLWLLIIAIFVTESSALLPNCLAAKRYLVSTSHHQHNQKASDPLKSLQGAVPKILAASFSAFLSFQDVTLAAPLVGQTTGGLEKAVRTLEESQGRGDTIQSMADLYEVVGTKTLLARTKYKYVSNLLPTHF